MFQMIQDILTLYVVMIYFWMKYKKCYSPMNSAYIHILYININPFSYPTYSLFHFREIEALKLANFDLNLRGENVEL